MPRGRLPRAKQHAALPLLASPAPKLSPLHEVNHIAPTCCSWARASTLYVSNSARSARNAA
jgi:hypothetical protein